MESIVSLLLTAFAVVSLQGEARAASFGGRHLSRRSAGAVSPNSRLPDGSLLSDLVTCSFVTCLPVDLSGCVMKEVMIWTAGNGRSCRTCEYCLDWPFRAAAAAAKARRRRSVPLLTNDDQLQQEPEVQHSIDAGSRLKRAAGDDLLILLQNHMADQSEDQVVGNQGQIRERRSTDEAANLPPDQVFEVLCPYVRCPVDPPNRTCRHTEVVEGWIRGRKCVQCATCIDDAGLARYTPTQ